LSVDDVFKVDGASAGCNAPNGKGHADLSENPIRLLEPNTLSDERENGHHSGYLGDTPCRTVARSQVMMTLERT
jgi:hypothetical protein